MRMSHFDVNMSLEPGNSGPEFSVGSNVLAIKSNQIPLVISAARRFLTLNDFFLNCGYKKSEMLEIFTIYRKRLI